MSFIPVLDIFNTILYQPLFNALVLLYVYLPGGDFGIAVIVLTGLIKVVLYPLGAQGIKTQKNMQELQPKLDEIRQKFSRDKEKQARATMELYQKEKINPLSGCLPLAAQIVILFTLFQVFSKGLDAGQFNLLYGFVPRPEYINSMFLGILDLNKPSIVLALLAGFAQFFQTKMLTPKSSSPAPAARTPDFSQIMQKQMLYFFPLFTVFILWRLPVVVGLYWLATSIFTIIQQYFILKSGR